ncbi:glycogen debranching protein GlgX [Rudanella lutea]|uniref:glycogen debranching protein GlgX n=1 Tax=Rudanella lutea TaxID=451374 RepID=UPI0003768704|nr:glycogen debranching protein GlgX [Rudanella lutea]
MKNTELPTDGSSAANPSAPVSPNDYTTRPGKPYPLGATPDAEGTNFALFSGNATAVYLCLYDPQDPGRELVSIPVTERTELIWHIYVNDIQPGQLYGYRVDGPYDPEAGHYFNPYKLLLDPYAKAIHAPVVHDDSFLGYDYKEEGEERVLVMDTEDSGPHMPKSIVVDSTFDWEGDTAPDVPMARSIIYEVHVKGFTHQHPTIPEEIRGTYAGMAAPESIDYLKKLGVTAVELLPVHQFTDESYWGYNSIGFFAPQNTYSASGMMGGQVTEFKEMVKALHKAGIEVILDVVYNHTAEGNQMGPTLSMKGIDNRAYYRQVEENPIYFNDFTGTGNTVDLTHPRTLQLVMDSLRYWVTEMHVDGFRFDLASALIRDEAEAGRVSSFLDTVAQDPILAQVKLIAEPWDIGSYHVGQFPVSWAEWNGKYRDCVRKFWKGDAHQVPELASRLLGSPDLYANDGRSPVNSVNLITAHDGFTLNDLVSYNEKHNEANGEDNRDGANDNESWNHGAEGPTDDPEINQLRERQKRNFLATLLLSQGTPMIVMGDECGRTQNGNNNVYNQDNELSWMNWNWTEDQQALFDFTSRLTALRGQMPLLRRRKFYDGEQITWVRPDGHPFTDEDWANGDTRCVGLYINGDAVTDQEEDGSAVEPDHLLWVLNAYWEELPFHLPKPGRGHQWAVVVNSADQTVNPEGHKVSVKTPFMIPGRSSVLLKVV